jgi:hypothetical protein
MKAKAITVQFTIDGDSHVVVRLSARVPAGIARKIEKLLAEVEAEHTENSFGDALAKG